MPILWLLMGVSLALTLHATHLAIRRRVALHALTAAWCATAFMFQFGRVLEQSATTGADALIGTKTTVAAGILIVGLLIGIARALARRPLGRIELAVTGGLTGLLLLVHIATPAFTSHVEAGVGGPTVVAGPLFTGFLPYVAAGLTYALVVVARADALPRRSRRVILAGYAIYLLFGVNDVLVMSGALQSVTLFEYGFALLAVGQHMLQVQRMTQALDHLEDAVADRTAKLAAQNAALDEAATAARAAATAKSAFLANMSHEIRTPLNGVIGTTELLRDMVADPEGHELVEMVHSSGLSLLALLNDILDFSKIDAGKLQIERHEFDVAKVVSDVAALQSHAAAAKGLAVTTFLDPDVPTTVTGDALRIGQVLSNLVSNAVKFTETGGVAVRVSRTLPHTDALRLRFDVIDTGIGISVEAQARLFSAFEQADASTTRSYGGTGLGLAISKRLVEAMGGRIALASAPGQGSTFWFEVPLAPAPVETEAAPITGRTRRPTASPTRRPVLVPVGGPRRHALIVEDNDVNRELAKRLLSRLGWTSDAVGDGRAALEALAARSYDLVVMDCQMPVMDGYETTRRMRARLGSELASVRIVGVSAAALPSDRERALNAGMDDYIEKPLRLGALAKALSDERAA